MQRKAAIDLDGKFIDTVKRLDSQIVGPDRSQLQLIYSAAVDDPDSDASDWACLHSLPILFSSVSES